MVPIMFRNVVSNWAAMVVNVLVSFFMTPFVIRRLGTDTYGFWALLQSVVAYMFLLDFGVRSSLNRHLARLYTQEAFDEANQVLNTGLFVYLIVCFAIITFSCLLGASFHWFFSFERLTNTTVWGAVILIGSSVALRFPGGVFDAGLVALQRFDLVNYAQIFSLFIRTTFIVLSLQTGYGLLAMSVATFLGSFLNLVLSYLAAVWVCPSLQLRVSLANMRVLRMLAGHSFYAYILLGATRIVTDAGTIIVGAFVGPVAVTYYAIAGSLTTYANSIVSGVSTTISPTASQLEARGNEKGLQILCVRGSKTILLVGMPILLTLILSGKTFLRLWVGDEFDASYSPLVLLSLSWMFNYVQTAAACILMGLSRHRIAAWLSLIQAGVQVGLSLFLVKSLGMVGVAWSALVAAGVMNSLFQLHALYLLSVSVQRFFVQVLLPTAFAVSPFIIVLQLLSISYPPTHLLTYFLHIALAVASMVVCLPWLGLDRQERDLVWRSLSRWREPSGVPA